LITLEVLNRQNIKEHLMQHEEYGQLLMEAIRETLETMAFAEIVPFSMKIGDKELMNLQELHVATARNAAAAQASPWDCDWGDDSSGDATEEDAWGATPTTRPPTPEALDDWGTCASPVADMPITDKMWDNPLDAWVDNAPLPIPEAVETGPASHIDFDKLAGEQEDWCWACLKVNSPELDSIWFIVSKQLAQELARTMYAGDDYQLDNPALRDIIAELTNVLGGRLMLLLEEIVGKFTLEVPVTGTEYPDLPDNTKFETVTCKVFVDGAYPVISVMCFKEKNIDCPGNNICIGSR